MTLREFKLIVSTTNYAKWTIKEDEFFKFNNVSWSDIPSCYKEKVVIRAVPRALDTCKVSVTEWFIIIQ